MVLASIPAAIVRHTLHALSTDLASTPFPELACLNLAGEALCNAWPWNWLRRQARPLSLRAYQPWVDLPLDFREVIDLQVRGGLLSSVGETSLEELAEARASSVQSTGPYAYLWAVEEALPENWNLLSATESFATSPWDSTNVTVTPGGTTSPVGIVNGTTLTTTVGTSDRVSQDVPRTTGPLVHGQTYIYALHLKAGTATTSDLVLEQQGLSAPTAETSSRSPRTVARVTWSAGVGTIAVVAASSRGAGVHFAGIESIGDSWYRAWVAITYDAGDAARPVDELRCAVLPGTSGLGGTVHVFGGSLERCDQVDEGLSRPRPYRANTATALPTFGAPVRRLAIWPTPTADQFNALSLTYRRAWKPLALETDTVEIPTWLEPIYTDVCIAAARGYHEEDDAGFYARFHELRTSSLFKDATEQDMSSRVSYGPMRGSAAGPRAIGRDWTRGTVVNPP